MTPFDRTFELVIRFGHHTRTVASTDMAAALDVPPATLRTALLRLLFASSNPDRVRGDHAPMEPTEGVESPNSETEETERESNSLRELARGEWGSPRGRGGQPLDAAALADALADQPNLPVYRALVARHPPARLEAALRVVQARPRDTIRTTPAAYFTGVMRALEARAAPQTSYAGTPPPSPGAAPPRG